MLTVRPLLPGGWACPPPRKRPGYAVDNTPQIITSSTCQRQRLSRCSRHRVPAARVAAVLHGYMLAARLPQGGPDRTF
jgi:hypothetical protein